MRKSVFALSLAAGLFLPLVASAVAPPTNILFAGTIARKYLRTGGPSWCLFEGSNSTFIRRGALTLISFPDVTIAPTGSIGPAYTVGGQASMRFNTGSTTDGKMSFTPVAGNPNNVNNPLFTDYVDDYNTATHVLTVNFKIRFPDCTLLVDATYRN